MRIGKSPENDTSIAPVNNVGGGGCAAQVGSRLRGENGGNFKGKLEMGLQITKEEENVAPECSLLPLIEQQIRMCPVRNVPCLQPMPSYGSKTAWRGHPLLLGLMLPSRGKDALPSRTKHAWPPRWGTSENYKRNMGDVCFKRLACANQLG